MTISERIAELREYARQDGDRCNESSIADVLAFPPAIAGMDGPYLFLEESGDLRALFRNARWRFGIDFYGRGEARLIVFFLDQNSGQGNPRKRSEISRFNLAGMPPELTEESFLAFVSEHLSEEAVA
jgi:hypothetical protein